MLNLLKQFSLFTIVLLNSLDISAQDFITRWELPVNSSYLGFNLERDSGGVNYTWVTIPAGISGAGNFPAGDGLVQLPNIPAGATVRLKLAPENLRRFYYVLQNEGLMDVEAWGSANWSSMEFAFYDCPNLQISATDIPNLSNVTSLAGMFDRCTNLNGPSNINSWNTQNVTNMAYTFSNTSSFNQPLLNWNTSSVTNMSGMFANSSFNQPIGNWITNNVTSFHHMFDMNIFFNQNINSWNTSNLISTNGMFSYATAFNQPIGSWNTSNVTNMFSMFIHASSFNQDLSNWNTSNVQNMEHMFHDAFSFNQDINSWDVSGVDNMYSMFLNAYNFNQSLSNWDLNDVYEIRYMLSHTGLDCDNYSSTLVGWSQNPNIASNQSFILYEVDGLEYSQVAAGYRDILINSKGWDFVGDVLGGSNCTASISENNSTETILYPNPVKEMLNVESGNQINELIITDALGKVLLHSRPSSTETKVNLADLTVGYYFVKLVFDNAEVEIGKIYKN
jgi:surface protein